MIYAGGMRVVWGGDFMIGMEIISFRSVRVWFGIVVIGFSLGGVL